MQINNKLLAHTVDEYPIKIEQNNIFCQNLYPDVLDLINLCDLEDDKYVNLGIYFRPDRGETILNGKFKLFEFINSIEANHVKISFEGLDGFDIETRLDLPYPFDYYYNVESKKFVDNCWYGRPGYKDEFEETVDNAVGYDCNDNNLFEDFFNKLQFQFIMVIEYVNVISNNSISK